MLCDTIITCVSEPDWTDVVGVVIAILGALFASLQWSRDSKVRRADFIKNIIEKLRSDNDMKDALYLFEYGDSWYNAGFHKGAGGLEPKVDKLLQYYTYICYLKNNCLLRKKEFCLFQYEIVHTLSNKDVQDYLYNIYHFSERVNTEKDCYGINKSFPFYHLIRFGIRKGVVQRDFLDENVYLKSNKYHHILNI